MCSNLNKLTANLYPMDSDFLQFFLGVVLIDDETIYKELKRKTNALNTHRLNQPQSLDTTRWVKPLFKLLGNKLDKKRTKCVIEIYSALSRSFFFLQLFHTPRISCLLKKSIHFVSSISVRCSI